MVQEEDGTKKLHFTYTASDIAGNEVVNCPYDISGFFKNPGWAHVYSDYVEIQNLNVPDFADLYYINEDKTRWTYSDTTYENDNRADKITPSDADTVLAAGNFIKICPMSKAKKILLVPKYIYYGNCGSGDSSYNFMIPSGGNSKSVIIGSDAPVLVATYGTNQPLEVCQNWSEDDWRMFGKEHWPQVLKFSNTDTTPRRYNYWPSDTNAVVIAFFANSNTTIMSDVIRLE